MLISNINSNDYDHELWTAIKQEMTRQEEHIELIASENYTSKQVMEAQGSQLTNKYAEGYPGNRYYGGCKYIDIIEKLAINRAKILFNADYANVQPHSGSQANYAVYTALLSPGDTILGMKLTHGGHLTHGAAVNFSGKLYNSIFYGIDKKGNIDYKQIAKLAKNYKPKMIIGGFSAYSGIVDWAKMRTIADTIKAYLLVDMAHVAGLVAAKLYPNPLPYAHVVTTTTHKTLAGPRGGLILAKGGCKELYNKINAAVFPGTQGGPLVHIIAAKAIALKTAMTPQFKIYQQQVINNAQIMLKIFLSHGIKSVYHHTYNHIILLDLTNKNLTGKDAELMFSKVNITINKNCIPNDKYSSVITSGIRIGTSAITQRGFTKNDVKNLAEWMCEMLNNINNKLIINKIKKKVLTICHLRPVYL